MGQRQDQDANLQTGHAQGLTHAAASEEVVTSRAGSALE